MKEIIIKVDDELYNRAREALVDFESSVEAHVQSYLKELNGDDARVSGARSRMKELFSTTKGFGVGQKTSREEMHVFIDTTRPARTKNYKRSHSFSEDVTQLYET